MEVEPSSPKLFPEAILNQLIQSYKAKVEAERADLFMVYDHGTSHRCIIVASTEEGYAGAQKTTFNIPKEKWRDEQLVVEQSSSASEENQLSNVAAVFVDGWHIKHTEKASDAIQPHQPLSRGPVAILKIVSSPEIRIPTVFREEVDRQVVNALWLSRSHRFLESTLLLQNLALQSPESEFAGNALESLFKYIRADIVFSIQKRGPKYRIIKCVKSEGDTSDIQGSEIPEDSVFHPHNHEKEIGERQDRCELDKLILGKDGTLFAIEPCEVRSSSSLIKSKERKANFQPERVAIMYLCVAGKREFEFEYQFFSETDHAILAQVASSIAAHMDTSKLASGYRDLNDAFNQARKVTGSAERDKYTLASDLQDKFEIKEINKRLPKIVQNVGSCFVVSKSASGNDLRFIEGSRRYFDEDSLQDCIERASFNYRSSIGYVNCVKIYGDASGREYYFCYHTLALKIAHYKAELISFLVNEFRVNFQEFLEIERRVNMMAQFQHATKGPLAAASSAFKMLSNRATIYLSNPNMLARLSKTNAHKSAITEPLLWIEKSRQLGDFAQILVEGYSANQVKWKDTNISELVQSSVDLFKGYAKSRSKRISLDIEEKITNRVVSCDYRAIEVVIHNLIDNGIKYGHRDRGVKVKLGLDEAMEYWSFSVEDIGEPIPEEDSQAIYESFRRSSDANVTRRRSGMGLGLAICKEILDAHTQDHGLGFEQQPMGDSGRSTEVVFSFKMPLLGKGRGK